MTQVTMSLTVTPGETSDHKNVPLGIMSEALRAATRAVDTGAESGRTTIEIPHSHGGDSCKSSYRVRWQILGELRED